jgi:aminopeptidase N
MVALPWFISGAMENWGLITYRERRMIYDNTSGSLDTQIAVGEVVAHELAHMVVF